ncbi:hypothetical protein ACOMHN_029591 [Nucella lapillus]
MRHTVWAVTLVTLATFVVLVSAGYYTDECSHNPDPLVGFKTNFGPERFRYNTTSGQCEMFHSRYNDHHPNDFPTLKDCNQACVTECSHHPDPLVGFKTNFGPKRIRYNTTSRQCEMFHRRSDDHHPNNFHTKNGCNQACVKECSHHPDPLLACRFMSFPKFRYNTASGECENYWQDSCYWHPNSFHTLKDCNQVCVTECSHHPDPLVGFKTNFGPKRFRYNTTSGECEMFRRRSDDHHPNNFHTLNDCNQACVT